MIQSQKEKLVAVTPPGALVDNAAFTTAVIDTLGWDYCTIYCIFGAMDIAMAALKVQEDDALNGSNLNSAAHVAGLVSGTSTDIAGNASALPSATADNTIFAFDIDLRSRKRY